jgi:hypothetical protein
MVQLANVLQTSEGVSPKNLNHFQKMRAAVLTANLAPGYTLGQAVDYLDAAAKRTLPGTVTDLSGLSREYRDAAGSFAVVLLLAAVFIYLVLAAQFESFVDPFIIMLSVPLSMTGAFAGLLIDFQFYAAAASANMGSKGNASFFANFYILLNFSSLLLQLFATPKIQDKVGLRGGLMVLPIALIGGATFVTLAATALSRSVLRMTEGGLRSSVHRSIWEQAFIPVDSSDRSSVKIAVDSIGARIAEAIGAVAILLWLKQAAPEGVIPMPLNTNWIGWVTLVTVAVWLLITQKMRVQIKTDSGVVKATAAPEIDCERFPDQCPCTTELGKGIA